MQYIQAMRGPAPMYPQYAQQQTQASQTYVPQQQVSSLAYVSAAHPGHRGTAGTTCIRQPTPAVYYGGQPNGGPGPMAQATYAKTKRKGLKIIDPNAMKDISDSIYAERASEL
jgi:hypothetical protein